MGKLWDKLMSGRGVDDSIETIVEEEAEAAVEDVRPEIRTLVREQLRAAMDRLKDAEESMFDEKMVKRILGEQFEEAVDTYEDEIQEAISEVLLKRIGKASITMPTE